MDLILVRHGNTFSAEETPYWVGSEQDLPLTTAGLEQAELLADYLKTGFPEVAAIYSSNLKRTQTTASILHKKLSCPTPLIFDSRLAELNYGHWGGLSNEQIIEQFGQSQLDEWNKFSRWPANANFGKSAAEISAEVKSLAMELIQHYPVDSSVILVSSNGRLRFFLNLIFGAFEDYLQTGKLKVHTGAFCHLRHSKECWEIVAWNKLPA